MRREPCAGRQAEQSGRRTALCAPGCRSAACRTKGIAMNGPCWRLVCLVVLAALFQAGCDGTFPPDVLGPAKESTTDATPSDVSPNDPPPDDGGGDPNNPPLPPPGDGESPGGGFTIEQTLSAQAQRNTIAFDALATLHQRRRHAEPVDPLQDRCEQVTRRCHFGHLEDHIPWVGHDLRPSLD